MNGLKMIEQVSEYINSIEAWIKRAFRKILNECKRGEDREPIYIQLIREMCKANKQSLEV